MLPIKHTFRQIPGPRSPEMPSSSSVPRPRTAADFARYHEQRQAPIRRRLAAPEHEPVIDAGKRLARDVMIKAGIATSIASLTGALWGMAAPHIYDALSSRAQAETPAVRD